MSLIKLTFKSILSRKVTSSLLILSIALSTTLLIGIQKIKMSAKESFNRSISGTDLIIGARSGDIQLLLYTIFHQGHPVANISWKSIQAIRNFSEVDWLIPLSLGDSHRGYPVLGTTLDYFTHYQYGKRNSLKLQQGHLFKTPFEVVIGSEIAKKLNYKIGDTLFIAHGMSKNNLPIHKNNPFKIVGILKKTRTPIDKTIHITLEGISALHTRSQNTVLTPQYVTGCLVGLKNKFSIFTVKNRITTWSEEPLMAIIPGVSLSRLWNTISTIDTAFLIITILVTIIALIGLLLSLFLSLRQRKRELAILRTMGAHPSQLFLLLTTESLLITGSGVIVGLTSTLTLGTLFKPFLEDKFGLILSLNTLNLTELTLAGALILSGLLTGFIPALLAYQKGLSEGFISI